MKEYESIYKEYNQNTLKQFEKILKEQFQKYASEYRTYDYASKQCLKKVDDEITNINTFLFKEYPLTWDLFRDRSKLYRKYSERLILENEVKTSFEEEHSKSSNKKFTYIKFIKQATSLETLISIYELIQKNEVPYQLMYDKQKFGQFKLVPKAQLKDKNSNIFEQLSSKKSEMKALTNEENETPSSFNGNWDELIEQVKLKVLQDLETNKSPFYETEFIGTKQLATYLQKAEQTIYGLVNQNKIPYEKRGQKLYFEKQKIIEWIKSGKKIKVSTEEKVDNFFTSKNKYNKK